MLGSRLSHQAPVLAVVIGVVAALAFASLVLWSFAASWRFPEMWPHAFTFETWRHELSPAVPMLLRTLLAGCAALP